jgi:hypothetical protein
MEFIGIGTNRIQTENTGSNVIINLELITKYNVQGGLVSRMCNDIYIYRTIARDVRTRSACINVVCQQGVTVTY